MEMVTKVTLSTVEVQDIIREHLKEKVPDRGNSNSISFWADGSGNPSKIENLRVEVEYKLTARTSPSVSGPRTQESVRSKKS